MITTIVAGLYQAALPRHVTGRLLDLGCGKAPFYAAYKGLVTEVTCADWENSLHKNEHLDCEVDLSRPRRSRGGVFDLIILSDVLEHIANPDHLWLEISRILAQNGKILMNAPFYYWLHEQPYDYYRYTRFALQRFVETAGMRLIELRPIGAGPEVIADILAKTAICGMPRGGFFLARMIQNLTLSLIKTSLGGRLSQLTADDFPLGYFLVAQKLGASE